MTGKLHIDDAPLVNAVSLSDAKTIAILRVDNLALEEGVALLESQIEDLTRRNKQLDDQYWWAVRGKDFFEGQLYEINRTIRLANEAAESDNYWAQQGEEE